ncbi:ABC transporter substrate-binding protein [Trebonia kvetii]|uniref:ABC transporter substrate-binding protein n=2 Tax=Trebonia kvetii TaxID=2480626 RepID=A0A6P2C482_9ACTN|nr:ABC transporter substrate-binding protein [Trebonia kvetii]
MQVAFQSDPDTFDPQVCYDATCWDNMQMMFDRLYDYKAATTQIQPEAAASMPVVSGEGKVYTIAIRQGMTFDNGKPVTAADFVYTFSRICDPATKSPVVGFWNAVAGCQDFAKNPVGSVSGIKATGKYTLQITLTQSDAAFTYVLAMPHASVIPAGSGAQQAQHPLGSGPFELVSYNSGQSIVLKANPHYWNKGLPYVDGVNEKLGVTSEVQLLELEKGQIDLMGDPLPNSDYLSVINNKSLASQINHRQSLDTYFLTLNTKVKPFDNPKVREAVSYAIDRNFLLKLVNGQGSPATGFIPPGVTGYTNENLVNPLNVAKAKQLLAQAGYPHGFTTTLYSWNTQPWTNLDPAIQQQLAAIGITVKVQPLQQSTFFTLAGTPGKAPMTLTFWVADYPDASDFFQALTSCAAAIPGGQNYSFYCNKQADADVNAGLADPANAAADYVKADKELLADNPVIPLYFGTTTSVSGASVGGFFANPIWDWEMDYYWLKQSTSGSSNSGGLGG